MFGGLETDVEVVKMHPIIVGYFQMIPQPHENWPMAKRTEWMNGLTAAFNVLFKDEIPEKK